MHGYAVIAGAARHVLQGSEDVDVPAMAIERIIEIGENPVFKDRLVAVAADMGMAGAVDFPFGFLLNACPLVIAAFAAFLKPFGHRGQNRLWTVHKMKVKKY